MRRFRGTDSGEERLKVLPHNNAYRQRKHEISRSSQFALVTKKLEIQKHRLGKENVSTWIELENQYRKRTERRQTT